MERIETISTAVCPALLPFESDRGSPKGSGISIRLPDTTRSAFSRRRSRDEEAPEHGFSL
jgi:hypothetical protein